jgi:hypothetical protein
MSDKGRLPDGRRYYGAKDGWAWICPPLSREGFDPDKSYSGEWWAEKMEGPALPTWQKLPNP